VHFIVVTRSIPSEIADEKTAAPTVTTIAPRPPAAAAALFADSGSGPGGEGSGAGSGVSTQPYRPCTLPCRRQRRNSS
jgi:hypothetical protein